MRSISPSSSSTAPPHTAGVWQRTAWHSPVPYLFGGLAAMLGLIAFALLILACSYWKLSVQSEEERDRHERDLESGTHHNINGQIDGGDKMVDEQIKVYDEKILVIMAGDRKPTFLATPATAPKLISPPYSQSNINNNDDASAKIHSAEKEMEVNSDKFKEMGHHQNHEHQDQDQEQAE